MSLGLKLEKRICQWKMILIQMRKVYLFDIFSHFNYKLSLVKLIRKPDITYLMSDCISSKCLFIYECLDICSRKHLPNKDVNTFLLYIFTFSSLKNFPSLN